MALSQSERVQISGELLDLPGKVQAASDAQAQIAVIKADLLVQDGSVKIFFDKYNNSSDCYQNEHKDLNGTTYTTIIEQDVVDSAQRLPTSKFFPNTWSKFIPQKHTSSTGLPTTLASRYEQNILSNASPTTGLTQTIGWLLNGITGASNATTTAQNPNHVIAPGVVTNVNLDVTSSAGFTSGEYVFINEGAASGIYKIASIPDANHLNVDSVLPSAIGFSSVGFSIKNTVVGFTNAERDTLTSGTYQELLDSLTTLIPTLITEWETKIDSQITNITNNTEDRTPQKNELTIALADVNNTKSIIDTWQALANTGSSGKYVNTGITPITSEITARQSFIPTRITQIITALGTFTQNAGDGVISGSGMYFKRHEQVDSRINLAGGPLTEFYEKDIAVIALQNVINTNNQKLATFSTELVVEKLTANANGTNIITVGSVVNFAVSNTVFIVSDTLTELAGTITAINGLNITLSFIVSTAYIMNERARLYKQL